MGIKKERTPFTKIINDNRSILMSFAILWVVFFHSYMEFSCPVLQLFRKLGNGGVDIFLLLSGIGIYNSLNKDFNLSRFYKKRLLRLLPSYYLVIIAFFVLQVLSMSTDTRSIIELIKGFFGNVFFIGNLAGCKHQFNWYIQAIMWYYLLSPILFLLVKKINGNKLKMLLVFVLVALMQIPFFYNDGAFVKFFARFPIYLIGLFVGDFYYNKRKPLFSKWVLVLFMVLGFACFVIMFEVLPTDVSAILYKLGFLWYPFILIAPGMCLVLGWFFELFKKSKFTKIIYDIIALCGKQSFGVYLIHILINGYVSYFLGDSIRRIYIIGIMFISIVLGILYGMVVDHIANKIFAPKKNKEQKPLVEENSN